MSEGSSHIVILPSKLERELLSACRNRLPYEACGVVFGESSAAADGLEIVQAESFAVVRNASTTPERSFRFAPEDYVAVVFQAQKNQRKLVGFFHSHLSGELMPSSEDGQGSIPWGTYWIVGIGKESGPQIAVYRRNEAGEWIPLSLRRVP